MDADGYRVTPIGWVESTLVDPATAPKQGDEGGPEAWLVFSPEVGAGLGDLVVDAEMVVLTWLDRARRDLLLVHPRDDLRARPRGVFSTRSADRPNPIGLHRVRVVRIDGTRILVHPLEAVHGTPVLDLKPVLGPVVER